MTFRSSSSLDLLKKSAPSRIIFVSSLLAHANNLSLENIKNRSNSALNPFLKHYLNYGNSKLMNIITSNTIAEKLSSANVTCNSLHPGVVITPIHNKLSHELTLSRHIIQKILLPIIGKVLYRNI